MLKPQGVKGGIFVYCLNDPLKWPQPIKQLFIGKSHFSVKKYSVHKGGLIFYLDQVRDKSSAESLRDQAVFLPKSLFQSRKGEFIYLTELRSFSVHALGRGLIGEVQAFYSHSFQDFLLVQQEQEPALLIPFVKEYVHEIFFSQKKLILNLPENFLEVFS